jgi:hypothetical protein
MILYMTIWKSGALQRAETSSACLADRYENESQNGYVDLELMLACL